MPRSPEPFERDLKRLEKELEKVAGRSRCGERKDQGLSPSRARERLEAGRAALPGWPEELERLVLRRSAP